MRPHASNLLPFFAPCQVIRRLKLELLLTLGDDIPAPPPGTGPHITLKVNPPNHATV